MNFDSLASFASHLLTLQAAEALALREGLDKAAAAVEATAKSEIGVYQDAVAPFPAWADLADSTEREKERLGYPLDAPLLRTGELRDSISHEVSGLEAAIGTPSQVMVYQELGTDTIPPRPVLGPAAIRNEDTIQRILGRAAVTGLLGGASVPRGLGYDFDT